MAANSEGCVDPVLSHKNLLPKPEDEVLNPLAPNITELLLPQPRSAHSWSM